MPVQQEVKGHAQYKRYFRDAVLVSELPHDVTIDIKRQCSYTPLQQAREAAKRSPGMITKYADAPSVAEYLVTAASKQGDDTEHLLGLGTK